MIINKLIRFIWFLMLVIVASWQMSFAIREQLGTGESVTQSTSSLIRNARILTYQAKEKHLFEADLSAAEMLLQNALKVNSVYVPAWLSLVELYNDRGEKDRAARALTYADTLTQGIKRWRWDKALVAYQTGTLEMLPAELSYIIQEIPGKSRNDALQLAFTLWKDPEAILQNVGNHNIIHLFNYSVQHKLSESALYYWQVIDNSKVQWREQDVLSFLNMLLSVGEVSQASAVWRTHFNPDHLFYNGDFDKKIMQRAFGWRLTKDKGFSLRLMPEQERNNSYNAEFLFKGWDNINFHHLTQIVPLQSGMRYRLTVDMRSKKLTTDQLPFFEVYGYKCEAPQVKTEMVLAEQNWVNHSVEFDVPQDCSAMVIRLRRNESRHLDNKISGKFWVRNVAVTEIGEAHTVLDVIYP